ncbi:MAG: cbb3-type cytochrome oxidase assembly protein CcoS [Deltaproteobacteria bacterium]|nr:MAG: cbb3-type cytochrome oxidase assembly protein CcoS [Deltaproteobacteria bacterium]
MSIIYVLAPLALLLGLSAVIAFLWAVNKGQFDDMETPANRMLLEDEPIQNETNNKGIDS